MKADPKVSDGARTERAAFRAYLKRKLNALGEGAESSSLAPALQWVQERQQRYDKRPGGLGKR